MCRVILVYGGRTYKDYFTVKYHLDKIHSQTPITTITQGGATGTDTLSKHWAMTRKGIKVYLIEKSVETK